MWKFPLDLGENAQGRIFVVIAPPVFDRPPHVSEGTVTVDHTVRRKGEPGRRVAARTAVTSGRIPGSGLRITSPLHHPAILAADKTDRNNA